MKKERKRREAKYRADSRVALDLFNAKLSPVRQAYWRGLRSSEVAWWERYLTLLCHHGNDFEN